jgi:hypothetical protein
MSRSGKVTRRRGRRQAEKRRAPARCHPQRRSVDPSQRNWHRRQPRSNANRRRGERCGLPTGVTTPSTTNNWINPNTEIYWINPNTDISNSLTAGLGTGGQITLKADATVASGQPATHIVVDVAAYIL